MGELVAMTMLGAMTLKPSEVVATSFSADCTRVFSKMRPPCLATALARPCTYLHAPVGSQEFSQENTAIAAQYSMMRHLGADSISSLIECSSNAGVWSLLIQ